MKATRATLLTLALLALLAAPALADGDGGDDLVTKRFEVTLYGDVSGDFYEAQYFLEGGESDAALYCDPDNDPCEGGGGAAYSIDLAVERGAVLRYELYRNARVICAGTETLDSDAANSAFYDAGAGEGGCGDGPGAPGMPDAGAGATQEEDLPSLRFELAVSGAPPGGATFFAEFDLLDDRVEDFVGIARLADPDGDGVYEGGYEGTPEGEYSARIVQGVGTRVVDIGTGEAVSGFR